MMTRPATELLASASSLEEAKRLFAAGADALCIGDQNFALRPAGHFDRTAIREAVALAKEYQGRIYIAVNALMHQQQLEELPDYLAFLQEIGVDAIIFGDPSVLMTARQVAPDLKLHWNTETTSTNYHTVNFWAKKGARRALLARELSLEDVLDVKRHTAIEIQAQVHGATCIFHSRRELVSNYLRHEGKEGANGPLVLQEHNRENQFYPIFEDGFGTHIISDEDLCMIEHLPTLLEAGIDSLYIEGLLKPVEYNEAVVALYRRAIDELVANPGAAIDPNWRGELESIQPQGRPLGTGFYFKAQIY